MTPKEVRRTSLRDAFQVMRGYRRRQEDRFEPMAEMFKYHHQAEELYFARLYAAVINSNAMEKSDTVKPSEFLSDGHPAKEAVGMSKERLKANYEQFAKDHPDKVSDENILS